MPLEDVADARAAVVAARQRFNDSVVRAHDRGERVSDIAESAGFTTRRVYQLVASAAAEEKQARERLAELDSQYNRLVDAVTAREGRAVDYRKVTACQNRYAKKLAKRHITQPTVRQMMRSHAESQLLSVLDNHGDDPTVCAVRLALAEADDLRKRLADIEDTRAFGSAMD